MVPGVLSEIRYKVDVNTMKRDKNAGESVQDLCLNEIARAHITFTGQSPLIPILGTETGAFIIVDRLNNITVGAGMIIDRITSKTAVQKLRLAKIL